MKASTKRITKADIITYEQCPRLSHLDKEPPFDKKQGFLVDEAIYATQKGQKFFGANITITGTDYEKSAELTSKALSESQRVGGAIFQSDQVRFRLDLAQQKDDGLHFIEIKSSTHSLEKIKEYLPDIAAKIALLSVHGIRLGSASIALLNPLAQGPDAKNLFIKEDISEEATAMAKEINFTRIAEDINRKSPPQQKFCRSCAKCARLSSCFPQYPPPKRNCAYPRHEIHKT